MISLDTVAEFSWDFGSTFFLETPEGLYEWSSPGYHGDNTIRKSKYSSIADYCEKTQMFVRSKGTHTVRMFCGEKVSFE